MSEETVKNESNSEVTEEMVPEFEIEIGEAIINKERVIAFVRALLMLVSSAATIAGFAFDAEFVYQIILCVVMIVSMIWGYWKNNNWTVNAVTAQEIKNSLGSEE